MLAPPGLTNFTDISNKNQQNEKIETQVATIKATLVSFHITLLSSPFLNSSRAKLLTINAVVCDPALPPVSIKTGINAARTGTTEISSWKNDKIIEENMPKTSKIIIQGSRFTAILKIGVSR